MPVPTSTEYARALEATLGRCSDFQRSFVVHHYNAPDMTATATELAHAVEHTNYRVTNRWYGQLARNVSEELGLVQDSITPDSTCWLSNLLVFEEIPNGEWLLHLRPEVAEALEQIGWV